MAEVSLIPGSRLLGKSIREVTFRSRYGLSVVGIRRDGEALTGKLPVRGRTVAVVCSGGNVDATTFKRALDTL